MFVTVICIRVWLEHTSYFKFFSEWCYSWFFPSFFFFFWRGRLQMLQPICKEHILWSDFVSLSLLSILTTLQFHWQNLCFLLVSLLPLVFSPVERNMFSFRTKPPCHFSELLGWKTQHQKEGEWDGFSEMKSMPLPPAFVQGLTKRRTQRNLEHTFEFKDVNLSVTIGQMPQPAIGLWKCVQLGHGGGGVLLGCGCPTTAQDAELSWTD